MRKFSIAAASVLTAAGAAFGQDSVPTTSGGNDALSAYDAASQRVRYVVDGVSQTTSWGQEILVAPILKASRDADPLYKTQILGAAAVSPSLLQDVSFPSRNFALWTAAGQGVNPTFNTPAGSSLAMTGFSTQFAVASSDFSLNPTNAIGAIVGRSSGNLSRLFVERVIAGVSRPASGSPDTATLSLGSVDAAGNLLVRADNFNTLTTTAGRVLGDNILRVNLDSRTSAANNIFASGSTNTATDTGATSYVVSNEATPTNVPASVLQPGTGPFALVFDFSSRLRVGSTTANLTNLATAHLGAGAAAHRGNPSFSPLTPLGGNAGTLATLALPTAGSRVNTLDACGLNFGSAGSPPSVAAGSARAFTLTAPISSPLGFTTNTSGASSFKQYLSQVPFRGGNGLVGVGQNAAGQLVLAATANDPAAGDYVAVVAATGPSTSSWTVAAFPGQQVLSGVTGSSIGTLTTPATISAPAIDRLGNAYFVATWTPTASPTATGLFKAVNSGTGYRLELILTTGQTITGANSTRPYTITALSLIDSDSIASGGFHHQQLIAEQNPGATTTDPLSIRAMGGLIVNAVITYNNNGANEAYDTVLFVSPTAGGFCAADFNQSGGVTVQDIFDFLAAYFSSAPAADFNRVGGITVQDIFDFLTAYFTACP
jgi:hypothetical protein